MVRQVLLGSMVGQLLLGPMVGQLLLGPMIQQLLLGPMVRQLLLGQLNSFGASKPVGWGAPCHGHKYSDCNSFWD